MIRAVDLWKKAGGSFYGPNVEHADMVYSKWLPFMDGLLNERGELIAALGECIEALEEHGVHNGGKFDPECLECSAVSKGRAVLAKVGGYQ